MIRPIQSNAHSCEDHIGENSIEGGYEEGAEDFDSFFAEDANAEFDEFGEEEEFIETAFPEQLQFDAEWAELHEAGFDHIDVAREAFPEIADADDADVEEFLFELTENMTPEELESFWKGLANFGRKALKVAAPIVQKAAPIVGTVIGAAFGGVGAPIGGAIGGLIGAGAGALNQAVNAPKQRRPRRRPRRRVRRAARRANVARRQRRQVRRVRRSRSRRSNRTRNFGAGVAQLGVSAGNQVFKLLQDPQIQNALLGLAQRGVGAIVSATGDSISETAAVAGLIGGLEQALQDAQDAGHDLDAFDGNFAPADFETRAEAFETLLEILGVD